MNERLLIRQVLGLLLLGLLSACATSPSSRFYVLTPLPEVDSRTSDIRGGALSIGIGPVVFPQFLDRPQLVMRDGSNRLDLWEFNRWGGTLQDDFLRVWGENLAYLLDTSRILIFPSEARSPLDFRITAEVVNFEGRQGGDAILKVRWAVMDSRLEQIFASRDDLYRCPTQTSLDSQDSESVVAAMSHCLGRFSRDVAKVLQALPKPSPPPPLGLGL
ncbi:MAG: PqiC family protein [Lamprobacter sp.]|uniref:PqiC family protein n=1 Tax=Lamprobacter sp. TaxID=3100796 RepID=UPI002B25ABAB|nr:PqiC family protein [Lamprobacter sp.]MEA3639471.1 PqiC family protein [Lamprobacter sp.]